MKFQKHDVIKYKDKLFRILEVRNYDFTKHVTYHCTESVLENGRYKEPMLAISDGLRSPFLITQFISHYVDATAELIYRKGDIHKEWEATE